MAVYTKLRFEEISDFLKLYSIGQLVSFKEIIDGIDNSNFIIETNYDKFILTIFERRIKKDDLPFFMAFKFHLAAKGIVCPKPILSNSGSLIESLKGKAAGIVTFLQGSTLKSRDDGLYDNITDSHCFQVGRLIASLHSAAQGFKQNRENDLGVKKLHQLFKQLSSEINDYYPNLKQKISEIIIFLEKNWPKDSDFPKLNIHSDLFPDNIFFNSNSQLVGVIDFYFSATDFLVYDIAIAVNAWCFNKNNQFLDKNFISLISGYESIKKLKPEEKTFLNIALVGASLRFFLTRMYDLIHTPKDSIVKVKDPLEYLEKLEFFFAKITKTNSEKS